MTVGYFGIFCKCSKLTVNGCYKTTVPAEGIAALHACNARVLHAYYKQSTS